MKRTRQAGSTMLEFTLVGIPLVFVLISIFEISRGMWVYTTLAHAIREGTRFAIVHGYNCQNPPNACTVTVGQIAQRIRNAGVGLIPTDLSVTLTSASATPINCSPLSACLTDATIWPPYPDNQQNLSISISGVYPFQSALSMLWPGAGGLIFNAGKPFNLPASSQDAMQF